MEDLRPYYQKKIDDYRKIIEFEHIRINERLTILCQFQGLLFGSLALGWEKNQNRDLIYILAFLGVFSSITLARSLYQAQIGIVLFQKEYSKIPKKYRELSGPVMGNMPVDENDPIPRIVRVFLTPGLVLPLLMLGAWLILIFLKLLHLG